MGGYFPIFANGSASGGFDKTSLISWWDLEEESGTRYDAHGDNDLTDNNTVLYGTGKVGNAADFETDNNEYLSIDSNSTLQAGDIDFTLGAWVKLEMIDKYHVIMSKWQSLIYSYLLWVDMYAPNKFEFYVSGASTVSIKATTFGSLSASTWYFVVAWHDSVANTINIQVNDGTADSLNYSGGINTSTTPFRISQMEDATNPAFSSDALIDSVFVFKRVLSADEKTWLYNEGNGRQYSDLG